MKKQTIKIGLVSYLNTVPFVHGINLMKKQNSHWDIRTTQAYPSKCSSLFMENKIDIGIIPVGILPKLRNYKIISDYCLGSQGVVASVLLLSHQPINNIKTILLDYQSNTSVLITKVLAKNFWNIEPEWINAKKGFENKIEGHTAGVVIGDRTFSLKNKFPYAYDLAKEWYKFQKLPFVFAVWVAKKDLSEDFVADFNKFLTRGVNEIPLALSLLFDNFNLSITVDEAYQYLTENISFEYTENMIKSKDKFLSLLNNLQ